MLTSELSQERITTGLPAEITEIPSELIHAFEEGVIKDTDLTPNLAARVSSGYRPDIEPPLTVLEQVARTKHISRLAAECVEQFLTQ